MKRFRWRRCFNCHDPSLRAGCVCWSCLRMTLIPLVLAALVRMVLG